GGKSRKRRTNTDLASRNAGGDGDPEGPGTPKASGPRLGEPFRRWAGYFHSTRPARWSVQRHSRRGRPNQFAPADVLRRRIGAPRRYVPRHDASLHGIGWRVPE